MSTQTVKAKCFDPRVLFQIEAARSQSLDPQGASIPVAQKPFSKELLELLEQMEKVRMGLNSPSFPDPNLPISHSIAAHILGSYFIKDMKLNGGQLEGTGFAVMTHYLIKLLDKEAGFQGLTPHVQNYRKALLHIVEFYEAFKQIEQIYKPAGSIASLQKEREVWHRCAQLYAQWVCDRLRTLPEDEVLTLPGGWSKHAMVYQVRKSGSGQFEMRVINTGAGLEYHASVDTDKEEFFQEVTLTVNEEIFLSETLWQGSLWQGYYEITMDPYPSLSSFGSGDSYQFSEKEVYGWLSAFDPNLRSKAVESARRQESRRPQSAGICAFEVLLALGKITLSTTPRGNIYHPLRSGMREAALRDYDAYLTNEGLLPPFLDSPPPSLFNKKVVYLHMGTLSLLRQEVLKLHRETLRTIRKKHEGGGLVHDRVKYLGLLGKRIDRRIEQCHAILKELTDYDSGASRFTTECAIASPSQSIKEILNVAAGLPEPCKGIFIPIWPAKGGDVAAFFKQVKTGLENLHDREAYNLLNEFFAKMPTVSSGYWEGIDEGDALSCLDSYALISEKYFGVTNKIIEAKQSDLHFFFMQKAMSVCLTLCQFDPIMCKFIFPLNYRDICGISNFKDFDVGCLFPTDPITDKQVQEVLKDLFRHCSENSSDGNKELEIVISKNGFYEDRSLTHVWDHMGEDLKKRITDAVIKEYGLPPKPALILAYALHGIQYAPSPGYKAVFQQIVIMQCFLKFKMIKGDREFPAFTITNIKAWEKAGGPDEEFILRLADQSWSFINQAVVKTFCPSACESQVASLVARTHSEQQMLRGMDQLIKTQGEYAVFAGGMQCREDRLHQVSKALLFYSQNSHLLSQPVERTRLCSLWFEPGVLIATLQSEPKCFIDLCAFTYRGYEAFREDKDLAALLFFLRLNAQVQAYGRAAGLSQGVLVKGRVLDFAKELQHAWNEAPSLKDTHTARYYIAREALAYYGRGGRVKERHLADFLRYHFFLRNATKPKQKDDERLEAEADRGKTALTLHIKELTNPLLSQLFSEVAALTAEERGQVKEWNFQPGDLADQTRVIITSSDDRHRIDFLKAEMYTDGQPRFAGLPDFLIDNAVFKALFPGLIQNTVVRYYDTCLTAQFQYNDDDCFIRVDHYKSWQPKYCFLRTWRSEKINRYCRYREHDELPHEIQGLVGPVSRAWFDESNGSLFFFDVDHHLTHTGTAKRKYGGWFDRYDYMLKHERTQLFGGMQPLGQKSGGFLFHLQKFDPKTRIWVNGVSDIVQIEFFTYGLTLTANDQRKIESGGDLAGFRLADIQHVQGLASIEGALVFENPLTGEKRVLLPRNGMENNARLHEDFAESIHFTKTLETPPGYCTFTVKEKEQLHSHSIKDVLHLTQCYMHLGLYEEASVLLQTQGKKLVPYTQGEILFLTHILSATYMHDPKAKLIRLRAFALFIENQELETSEVQEFLQKRHDQLGHADSYRSPINRYIAEGMGDDYQRYLRQVEMVSEAHRLTPHEVRLLSGVYRAFAKAQKHTHTFIWPSQTAHAGKKPVKIPSDVVDFSKESFSFLHPRGKAAPEKLFIEETPPLGMPRSAFVGTEAEPSYFLSLYEIARNRTPTPTGRAQRQALALWLCSARGHKDYSFQIALLTAILAMPDDRVSRLPHATALIKNEYEHLSNILNEDTQVTAFPNKDETFMVEKQMRVKPPLTSQSLDPFVPLPPLKQMSTDIPIKALLGPDFTLLPKEAPVQLTVKPLVAGNTDSFYLRSFEEMQQSIEIAAKTESERAFYTITQHKLGALKEKLFISIGSLTQMRIEAEQELLRIAHMFRAPQGDIFAEPKRSLELQAKIKTPLNLKELTHLFVRGDRSAYRFANPSLTTEEIEELYQKTADWLVLTTRLQQLERAYKETEVQKIYTELSTPRSYNYWENRLMLAMEAGRNIRFRASQKEQIDQLMNTREDSAHEIIMGSGKSDIIAPYLALAMAKDYLPILVMQEELFEVEATKLQGYAQVLGQEEICVNWRNRTVDGLTKLLYSLKRIKDQRGFIAVSIRQLHDFYIASLEQELTTLKDPNMENQQKRALYWEVKDFLYKQTIAYFDEIDSSLRCNFEVLKAVGEKQAVEKIDAQMVKALFDILVANKRITSRIYFKWSRRQEDGAQLYVPERDASLLIEVLSEEFLRSRQLANWGIKLKEQDRDSILAFLRAPLGQSFALPPLDAATHRAISQVRKLIWTIFPSVLGNIHQQHYGIPEPKEGEKRRVLPIPYRGGDNPQLTSQFASTAEQMVYTLMEYQLTANTLGSLVWEIVQKLKIDARLEMRLNLIPVEKTMGYKEYVRLFGLEFTKQFPLTEFESHHIKDFTRQFADDPLLINRFVYFYAFPYIYEHRTRLTSNAQTVPNLFRPGCRKGYSGTLAQVEKQFFSALRVYTDRGIIGKTLSYLAKTHQGQWAKPQIYQPTENPMALLEEQLAKQMQARQPLPQAIIDVGGVFKSVPSLPLAQRLIALSKQTDPQVQNIIYYDKKQNQWVICNENSQPQAYYPSPEEDRAARGTVFDQGRCTGSNILQKSDALAWLFLNDKTDLQQFVQAAWRMRGLADKQRVVVFCSEEIRGVINTYKYPNRPHLRTAEISLEDIFAFVKHIEVVRQIQDNLKSVYQQIDAAFGHTILQILSQYREDYGPAVRLACLQLSAHLVTKVTDDPIVQYGSLDALKDTRLVLKDYVQVRVEILTTWYREHHTILTKPVSDFSFKVECDKLIDDATKEGSNYLPTQLSTKVFSVGGSSVDVQQEQAQQVQQEKNQNLARSSLLTDSQKDASIPYLSWPIMGPDGLVCKEFNASISTVHMPVWDPHKPSDAHFKRVMLDYQREWLENLSTHNVTQNPMITMAKALALTGKLAAPGTFLKDEYSRFFSENLLVSLNAIFTVRAAPPFYGAQKPLSEWMLLIQDKATPKNVQLVLLSRKDAEMFYEAFEKDNGKRHSERLYAIALFSPRKCALAYQDGIYKEGADKIDTGPLFSSSTSPLTDFEKLVLQALFVLGESALYKSGRQENYIADWLTATSAVHGREELFKNGFINGSLQVYEKSRLAALFARLKKEAPAPTARLPYNIPQPFHPVVTPPPHGVPEPRHIPQPAATSISAEPTSMPDEPSRTYWQYCIQAVTSFFTALFRIFCCLCLRLSGKSNENTAQALQPETEVVRW